MSNGEQESTDVLTRGSKLPSLVDTLEIRLKTDASLSPERDSFAQCMVIGMSFAVLCDETTPRYLLIRILSLISLTPKEDACVTS